VSRYTLFDYCNHLPMFRTPKLRRQFARTWRRELRHTRRRYPHLSSSRRRRIALDSLTKDFVAAWESYAKEHPLPRRAEDAPSRMTG
jgi:hypothetical protein